MIAKMTKDGILKIYGETEAEIFMLKCCTELYEQGRGAEFEVHASGAPVESHLICSRNTTGGRNE
jgi:hypothetical protein